MFLGHCLQVRAAVFYAPVQHFALKWNSTCQQNERERKVRPLPSGFFHIFVRNELSTHHQRNKARIDLYDSPRLLTKNVASPSNAPGGVRATGVLMVRGNLPWKLMLNP
eukprot:7538619-Pyramimonas_sp.AAC.1